MNDVKNYLQNALINTISKDKSFVEESILMNETNYRSNVSVGQNIILENIYEAIASELSLLKFNHIHREHNKATEVKNSSISWALNVSPNALQTSSDLLYTFFYQVVKYGNGIMLPEYDDKGDLVSLDVLDIEQYKFGKGYSERDGELYLLLVDKDEYAEYKTSMAGRYDRDSQAELKVHAFHYGSIIHVRYNPQMIMNNDSFQNTSISELTTVYDKNLNAMLDELAQNNQVSAVFKLKGMLGGDKDKEAKTKRLIRQIQTRGNYGVLTLDDGEEFTPLVRKFHTVDSKQLDMLLKQVYKYYGINENILDGTYEFEEYHVFYNKTLEPLIARLVRELNRKVIGRANFENGEMILSQRRGLLNGGSLRDITQAVDKYIYHGIATVNEIREEFGWEPVDGGDVVYTNANAVLVNTRNPKSPNTGQEPKGEDNNDKKLTLEFDTVEEMHLFQTKMAMKHSMERGAEDDKNEND